MRTLSKLSLYCHIATVKVMDFSFVKMNFNITAPLTIWMLSKRELSSKLAAWRPKWIILWQCECRNDRIHLTIHSRTRAHTHSLSLSLKNVWVTPRWHLTWAASRCNSQDLHPETKTKLQHHHMNTLNYEVSSDVKHLKKFMRTVEVLWSFHHKSQTLRSWFSQAKPVPCIPSNGWELVAHS